MLQIDSATKTHSIQRLTKQRKNSTKSLVIN